MKNIYFWQRGNRYQLHKYEIPGDLNLTLERYSKVWFGGCDEAELSVVGSKESLLLLLNLVRCGITIHTESAVPLWWGYVSRVEVEIDGVMATVDFENMANDLAVAYTLVNLSGDTVGVRQTTPWLKDADSIAEYGDRQLLESGASMNAVSADALARQKLDSLKLPKLVVTTRSNNGENSARIVCKGWYHLMEGRYCAIPTQLALSYQTFQTEVVSFATEEKWAQSFTPTSAFNLAEVGVYLKKVGAPGALSIALYSEVDGKPDTSLASGTLAAELIGTTLGWEEVFFSSAYTVTIGTKYFIVVSASSTDASNYYEFPKDTTQGYLGGQLSQYFSSDWVEDDGSLVSKVYNGATIIDQNGDGTFTEHSLELTRAGIGQEFVTSATSISKISIYVKKVGTPGNITVRLIRAIGTESEVNLGSATINVADVGTNFAWEDATFSSPIAVTAGETLAFEVSASSVTEANYYVVQVSSLEYATGAILYYLSSDWIERDFDAPFRLYSNVLVETTQQIQSYLTQYGEVLAGVRMDVASGIHTESFRNGDTTVYSELKAHQENGTSNYRRILSRVNIDRTVDVWEQPAEPWQPEIEYRMDGKIYYLAGSEIEPGFDPVGKWISVIPITKSSSYFSSINGMNNYFIDSCEWDEEGRPSIRPADWKNPNAVRVQNG